MLVREVSLGHVARPISGDIGGGDVRVPGNTMMGVGGTGEVEQVTHALDVDPSHLVQLAVEAQLRGGVHDVRHPVRERRPCLGREPQAGVGQVSRQGLDPASDRLHELRPLAPGALEPLLRFFRVPGPYEGDHGVVRVLQQKPCDLRS